MRTAIAAAIILFLVGLGITPVKAQTTSASSRLVAQPIPDRTVLFNYLGAGVAKPIIWGMDAGGWTSPDIWRTGINYLGAENIQITRVPAFPTDTLYGDTLQQRQKDLVKDRLNQAGATGHPLKIMLNPGGGEISWYSRDAVGYARYAQLMELTKNYIESFGHTVVSITGYNEPDPGYAGVSQQNFYDFIAACKARPGLSAVRFCGPNTLNPDLALGWYNYVKPAGLTEGNTHQLAGTFDSYANFFQTVKANGHYASMDEVHNIMEAMVGSEYGAQAGIYWAYASLARGEFVKASTSGVRLGYAEHRPNWTAASVYRKSNGQVQAFGGASERQATTTTYRYVSKDKDVYYDGYGPQREFTLVMPGGTGYGVNQPSGERVVNITSGEDIQPVINGRYVLVNRSSGKVMEVPGGSTSNGVYLKQNSYTGAAYQQWNVIPVNIRSGGDFSYFTITAAHDGKAADLFYFSVDDGAGIATYDSVNGGNQQYYFDYADDGYFYIRNRHSSKCLDIKNGTDIVQNTKSDNLSQQWRLLPIEAAIEFNAPGVSSNLVAAANATSIRLNWTASSETDVAGYTIFRSESAGGSYNTIARNVTTTSFVDNTATTGIPYFYKIKAVDRSLNRSAYSNQVSATTTGVRDTVAHLYFDGNTLDSTKNLNHSASYGGTSFSNGVVGSKAITLNGSDAFIQLPATIANHQEITIATWVNFKGGGNWQRIFDFGNDQSQYMFLSPNSGSGTLRFAIKNGGGEQIIEAPALATGSWSHVTVTLGTTGASLYVNGTLVAQSSSVTIRPSDFKPVLNYIGRGQYLDPLLNGSVDDFQIFNYALSTSEVQQLINVGLPAAVTNLRAASGDAKVILRWEGRFDTKYEVLRSETMSGTYAVVATNVSVTRYEDVNVVNGKTYYYKVVAYTDEGRSPETLMTGKPVLGQHVYLPFNEATGSLAEDAWGAKDATLAADAAHADGYNSAHSVALNNMANAYVTLPTGVVSTLNDFTISTWVKPNGVNWWMRVFDFGTGTNKYMYLTLQAGWYNGVTTVRYGIKSGNAEQQVSADYLIPWNAWTYFAVTQSGNTASLYINGKLMASNTGVTFKPSNLGNTTQNYIGKSQWPDPMLDASVDEFKIYNKALSAAELAEAMKAEQIITFNSFAEKEVGNADFDPGATASSGLPVMYSSSNEAVATILDGKVHITGAGTATITGQQAGNAQYLAADPKSQTVTVNKKEQTITFNAFADKKVGDADVDPAATASSSLPVTYSSSDVNVATITSDNKIHIVGGGAAVITASQNGNDVYKPSQPVTQQLHVFVAPMVKAKNIEVAVDENGNAVITSAIVDDGSVSYNGALTLVVDKANFTCSDVNTPVTVTLTGKDGKGYSSTATAIVTVVDKINPTITAPLAVAVDADKESCSATNIDLGSPLNADNCGIKDVKNDAPTVFPVGSTTVTWTVTDVHGNQATAEQTVTVTDNQKPVLTAPANQFFCFAGNTNRVPSLTTSDNCGISSITYVVSGATSRSGTGNDASGIFNVGVSTISWTVTDVHQNTSTTSADVKVNAPFTAHIGDVNAVDQNAGSKNTLYIGYGPGSLTLNATPTGGSYTYQWYKETQLITGQSTQSINVSDGATYSIKVTDARGCSNSASIVINTINVQCGNTNNKVMVCHNGNTICIASAAVQEHLSHGDKLGGCDAIPTIAWASRSQEKAVTNDEVLKVSMYPNPVNDNLTIGLPPPAVGATLRIYNSTGALVHSKTLPNSANRISLKNLPAGVYYVQITYGQQITTEKIVKQ